MSVKHLGSAERELQPKEMHTLNRVDFRSLQDAIDAAPQNGEASIFIPAGRWNESSKATVPDTKRISFFGAGADQSILTWSVPDGGLLIKRHRGTVVVKDITFETTQPNGGNAIHTKHPVFLGGCVKTHDITSVSVRVMEGSLPGAFWNTGLLIENSYNAYIAGFYCKGENDTLNTESAIKMIGRVVDNHIIGLSATSVKRAIFADKTGLPNELCEGLTVTAAKLVAVGEGVVVPLPGPGLTLYGIHINAYETGVFASTQKGGVEISGLTIFSMKGCAGFRGIHLEGTHESRIFGNSIYQHCGHAGQNAIILADAFECIVSNNHIRGMETGIWLKSDAKQCLVTNNLARSGKPVLDEGVENIVIEPKAPLETQANWRWCRKCGTLVFDSTKPCAAGGVHEAGPANSHNYSLSFVED